MRESQITICGHGSGVPSLKNMESYLTNRYSLIASNGRHKGLVAVRRLKDFTDSERKKFRDAYRSIIGRNYYSQSLRTHVFSPYNGKYYSDCSSSGDACYMKAGHNVGWLNTAGMYESKLFEDVPVVIKEGHINNPEVLKVGDALLFRGNDPSRPLQIGHVEYVYDIPVDDWHWVKSGAEWYYQDGDGRNSYGWKLVKETGQDVWHWYYFDGVGKMCSGLIYDDHGEMYYLQGSGDLEGACCKTDSRGVLHIWNLDAKGSTIR